MQPRRKLTKELQRKRAEQRIKNKFENDLIKKEKKNKIKEEKLRIKTENRVKKTKIKSTFFQIFYLIIKYLLFYNFMNIELMF